MRKIYMVDLGLLIAAGTIAAVLTAKPVSSHVNEAQDDATATSISGASAITPKGRGGTEKWVSYEGGDPEIQ